MSFKTWYGIHKWTSLVSTIFILMLCLTGLPLIFAHEIDHWLGHSVEPPVLDNPPAESASIESILADAGQRRPADAVQFLVADYHEPELLFVRMGESVDANDLTAFFTYDARNGDFLSAYPLGQGFMDVMLRLHVDMYAGLWGTLFLGFMGLLLLFSIISGVVLYSPYMQKLAFGTVRRNRVSRLKWLDLHNLLGIVTVVWLFVVGGTGVINTLSIPIFSQWQATELAGLIEAHDGGEPAENRVSIDKVVKTASEAMPDKALSFLAFPGNNFSTQKHYMAFMQGMTPLSSQIIDIVMIDAETGEVATTKDVPWYITMLLMSQPLHFGDYGGTGLKIVWALLDIISIIVLYSGLVLWWRRRTAKQDWPAKQGQSYAK